MRELSERLDDAWAGRAAPDAETAPLLAAARALEPLRVVPPRRPAAEQAGLSIFLSEAATLRGQALARAVSLEPRRRPTGWRFNLFQKEITPMNLIATLVLVASLALGGTGATVYAARDSLPNEPLYGVKLAAEDLRLGLSRDPQTQLVVLLELTQARSQEMLRLAEAGQAVPPAVAARLQTQLEATLQRAAGLADAQLAGALAQVQQQVQAQLEIMAQARLAAPAEPGLQLAEQALLRTRNLAQLGQTAPAQFRNQLRAGQGAPAAGDGPGAGACPAGTCTPQYDGNRYGPGPGNPAVTPAGGDHRYGPGPGNPDPAATPAGDQNRYGPGPQATQPAPGSPSAPGADGAGNGNSYGPGPVNNPPVTAACTPQFDGDSFGPGPGNPSVTPAGDNNSYGPGPETPDPAATPASSQNGYGPGPQPTQPSGSGSGDGYGPGPAGPSVTPAGDGNSAGPGPNTPEPAATPGRGRP